MNQVHRIKPEQGQKLRQSLAQVHADAFTQVSHSMVASNSLAERICALLIPERRESGAYVPSAPGAPA